MRILDQGQTAAVLPYSGLVPAIAQAARELAAGTIRAPERQVVSIDAASVLLSMPAIGDDISVTKLITVHANNAQHRLPAIQGEVIVFETTTGRRLAMLDGPTVTARRTAAMTLLGIETLAPKRPSSALIIGTGVQASAHADALAEYFGVSQFWVAARNAAGIEMFCKALQERHEHVLARPLSAEALRHDMLETDVVIAATTSTTPVVPVAIPAHTLAVGVGAFKPAMAELPPELLHGRQIVVDNLDGARHEAGDLMQANVDWTQVIELASVLSGQRPRPAHAPVFKTVGQAAWDLAAARVAVSGLFHPPRT